MYTKGCVIMDSSALYMDVYNSMLHAIQVGEYPENEPLPTERDLSEKYHVSRAVIRQALSILRSTDVVYTVRGHGTFVRPQLFLQPLGNFYTFTDTLKSSNLTIQNNIISYDLIVANQQLSKNTGYPEGTLFHKLVRLRSAEGCPHMLETTFLPTARFHTLDVDFLSNGSLYEYLRQTYRFHADRASETLRPVIPLPNECVLLQISSNTPCMFLERSSFEDNCLVEYTKSIVRGDKYVFHVNLNTEKNSPSS